MPVNEFIQLVFREQLAPADEIQKLLHGGWCRHVRSDLVPKNTSILG
jgi:hypothetical protein